MMCLFSVSARNMSTDGGQISVFCVEVYIVNEKRSSFSSRIGFVMAAAGSAVGLGNLWRFPYLAAKYGGGIFLLCYVLLAVTFGLTLMITEIAIGRKTRTSCINAYEKLDKRFGFLGPLSAIVPILIVPYYCVIGGWVVKYMMEYILGNGVSLTNDAYFTDFITVAQTGVSGSPFFWFLIFVLITAVVVLMGVEKGIEKGSTFMMPVLIVLCIIVAGYSLTLPGAMDGLKFYLMPDFSKFSVSTLLGAMGQLFYSNSLAMGIMITYGSYMKREDNLEKSVGQIEIFDSGVAFLAGLMVVPAVVAFNGGDPSTISAGPGLMFGVLPKVFDSMGMGSLIGILFFVLVFFAALTSSISLLETVVSIVQDKLRCSRTVGIFGVTAFTVALGALSCYGYGPLSHIAPMGMAFLDFFDFMTNSILMPIIAFITCVVVGHVIGTKVIVEEVESAGHKFHLKKMHSVMVRWIAPIIVASILAGEVAKYLGLLQI